MEEEYKFIVEVNGFTEMDIELEIVAKYDYEPAEGDGWNEPHYDAQVTINEFVADNPNDGLAIMLAGRYNALLGQAKMDFSRLEEAILDDHSSDRADFDEYMLDERRDYLAGF